MSISDEKLKSIVDVILNYAGIDEVRVIEAALERRKQASSQMGGPGPGGGLPSNPGELDFGAMAKDMAADIKQRFNLPDNSQTHEMTRRLVGNMIREHQPSMPEEHLQALLNQWVPGPQQMAQKQAQQEAGHEAEIPAEALMGMVQQFVSYSLNEMPQEEQAQMKAEVPDWPSRYWEAFSMDTKRLISHLLAGKMDQQTFWNTFKQSLRAG